MSDPRLTVEQILDLRELIRGTPFPRPGASDNPDEPIDFAAAHQRWMNETAPWRAALASAGVPWEPNAGR